MVKTKTGTSGSNENFLYVYCKRDGFAADHFDETQVKNRMTNKEFQEFIAPINQIIQRRSKRVCIILGVFILYLLIVVAGFAYCMGTILQYQQDFSTLATCYGAALVGGVSLFTACLIKVQGSESEIKAIVVGENLNRAHGRGLHWILGPDQMYLKLALKFVQKQEHKIEMPLESPYHIGQLPAPSTEPLTRNAGLEATNVVLEAS